MEFIIDEYDVCFVEQMLIDAGVEFEVVERKEEVPHYA